MKLSKRIGLALGCVAPIIVSTSFAISSCGNQPVVHTVKAINRSGKMNFNGVKGIASGAKTNEEFVLKFDDKTIEPNELTYSLTNCSTDRIQISPGGIISWSTDIEANTYNFNVVITYVAKDGKEYTATSENVKVVIVDGQIIATSTDLVQSGGIGKTAGSFNLQLGGEVTVADKWTATAASMSQNPFSIVDGTNGKTLTWNALLVEGVYNITITATKDSVNYSIDVKLTIEDLLITGLDTIYGDINGEDSPKQYKFGAQFFDEDVDATFSLVDDLGEYGINMSGNGILSWDNYGYDGTVTVKAEYVFADITFVSTKVINLKLDNAYLVGGTTHIPIDEPGESWPKEGAEPDPWKLMFGSTQMTTGVSFSVVEPLPLLMTFDIDVNGLISITNAEPGTYHIKATWGGTCLNVVSPDIIIDVNYYGSELKNVPTELTIYNNKEGSLSTSIEFIWEGTDIITNDNTQVYFTGAHYDCFSFDKQTKKIQWDEEAGHLVGNQTIVMHAWNTDFEQEYEEQKVIALNIMGVDAAVWNGQEYVGTNGINIQGEYGYVFESNVFYGCINGEVNPDPETLFIECDILDAPGAIKIQSVEDNIIFKLVIDYDISDPSQRVVPGEKYNFGIMLFSPDVPEESQETWIDGYTLLNDSPKYKLFGPTELNSFNSVRNDFVIISSVPYTVYAQGYREPITTGYELVVTNPDGADFLVSDNKLYWSNFNADIGPASCTIGVKPDESDEIYCQEDVTLTGIGEMPSMPYGEKGKRDADYTLSEEIGYQGGTLCIGDLSDYQTVTDTNVEYKTIDEDFTLFFYWEDRRLMVSWEGDQFLHNPQAEYEMQWQFSYQGVKYESKIFIITLTWPYDPGFI